MWGTGSGILAAKMGVAYACRWLIVAACLAAPLAHASDVLEFGVLVPPPDSGNPGCEAGLQYKYAASAVKQDLQADPIWQAANMELSPVLVGVDSVFNATHISLSWYEADGCVGTASVGATRCLKAGIIGPPSSDMAETVSQLARFYEVAAVSYSATSTRLSRRPYFMRAVPTDDAFAATIIELCNTLGWQYVSIVHARTSYGNSMTAELVTRINELHSAGAEEEELISVFAETPFDENDEGSIEAALEFVEDREARVIVIVGDDLQTSRVLLKAHEMGMTGVGYTYIGSGAPSQAMLSGADARSPEEASNLKSAALGMLGVSASTEVADGERQAWDETASSSPPFEYTDAELAACPAAASTAANTFLPFVYDALFGFAHAAARARICSDDGTCAVPFSLLTGASIVKEMLESPTPPVSPLTGRRITFDQDLLYRTDIAMQVVSVNPDGKLIRIASADWSDGELGEFEGILTDPLTDELVFAGGRTEVPSDRESVEVSVQALFLVLAIAAVLIAGVIGVGMENRHFFYIPESGVTIIVGMVVGGVLLLAEVNKLIEIAEFDESIFSLIFLPVIIFESGYSLVKHPFFTQIGTILIFAVFGTLISTAVVGLGIYAFGQAGVVSPILSWEASMAFAALISAVDPVATLATFGALKVDATLNAVVYGESVINDAVSLVLYRTFVTFFTEDATVASGFGALGNFFGISLGSLLIGALFGILCSYTLKVVHFEGDGIIEAGVVLLYAYLSFALSESMHLSGIVAVLTAGIIMNHYAQKNLSEKARPFVKNLLVSISKMADSIIFFLVGLNIVLFSTAFNAEFSFLVFGLCLIGRFCNIAPLTCCVNRFRKDKIPSNFAYIAWHSGLRGAIAYAISIEFPSQHRATIINATSFIILITVFVFGGSTIVAIKKLGVPYNVATTAGDHKAVLSESVEASATKRRIARLNQALSRLIVRDSGRAGFSAHADAENATISADNPLRRPSGGAQ